MADLTSPEFQSLLPPGALPTGSEPMLPGGDVVRAGLPDGGTVLFGGALSDAGMPGTFRVHGGTPTTVTGGAGGPGPVYAPPSPFAFPAAGPVLTGGRGDRGLGPVYAPPNPLGGMVRSGDRGLGPVAGSPVLFGLGGGALGALTTLAGLPSTVALNFLAAPQDTAQELKNAKAKAAELEGDISELEAKITSLESEEAAAQPVVDELRAALDLAVRLLNAAGVVTIAGLGLRALGVAGGTAAAAYYIYILEQFLAADEALVIILTLKDKRTIELKRKKELLARLKRYIALIEEK